MIPLVPAAWILGGYLVKKGYDYYDNRKNEKAEEDNYKREQSEKDENRKNQIETLPFFIATSYSMANIDGDISQEEQKIITTFQKETLKLMPTDKKLKITRILEKIEEVKKNIKLSEAISYINDDYETYAKSKIKESINSVVWADGREDQREKELLKRINIFIEKGRDSIKEIKTLENNDLLPNYYLTSNKDFKTEISSTKLITVDDNRFKNIKELQSNNYYVIHPMSNIILFDIKSIDKIETLIIEEWHSLANKLGAKSFSCTVEIEESLNANSETKVKGEASTFQGSASYRQKSSSVNQDYESKFTQFNYESKGAKCTQSKEELINNLLWLKNNTLALNIIDAMTSINPHTKFEIESSLKKFNDSNKQFNLQAHLSLLGKIDSELKINIENNISKKSHYKQKIIITF